MNKLNLSRYVPLSLCVLTAGKMLFLGYSLEGVGMLAVLSLLAGAFEYRAERKVVTQLKQELKEARETLEKRLDINDAAVANTFKQMGELKSFINSVKLNQSITNLKPTNAKTSITF